MSLATVRAIAETGVDVISVGALTHSVRALDLGLDIALELPADPALHPEPSAVASVGRESYRALP